MILMSLLPYCFLFAFTLSYPPTIVEAQKESNKRGELERSPNKRREVAPVWAPQFGLLDFWWVIFQRSIRISDISVEFLVCF